MAPVVWTSSTSSARSARGRHELDLGRSASRARRGRPIWRGPWPRRRQALELEPGRAPPAPARSPRPDRSRASAGEAARRAPAPASPLQLPGRARARDRLRGGRCQRQPAAELEPDDQVADDAVVAARRRRRGRRPAGPGSTRRLGVGERRRASRGRASAAGRQRRPQAAQRGGAANRDERLTRPPARRHVEPEVARVARGMERARASAERRSGSVP